MKTKACDSLAERIDVLMSCPRFLNGIVTEKILVTLQGKWTLNRVDIGRCTLKSEVNHDGRTIVKSCKKGGG